jgi:hypothetical protein
MRLAVNGRQYGMRRRHGDGSPMKVISLKTAEAHQVEALCAYS